MIDLARSRSALVALLHHAGDPPILGLDELTDQERDFLIATSCATVITYMVLKTANFDRALAIEGINALCEGIIGNINNVADLKELAQ